MENVLCFVILVFYSTSLSVYNYRENGDVFECGDCFQIEHGMAHLFERISDGKIGIETNGDISIVVSCTLTCRVEKNSLVFAV